MVVITLVGFAGFVAWGRYCTGDPGAADRAERVVEVTGYWQRKATQ